MIFYIKIFIIEASKWSEMLEKLPLKSTKYNLDFSNFWEFENESWEWEWEFSQQNWESRLRMRWEFSLRVSISRSRWESRRSLPSIQVYEKSCQNGLARQTDTGRIGKIPDILALYDLHNTLTNARDSEISFVFRLTNCWP